MKMNKRKLRLPVISAVLMTMLVTTAVPSFAAAPKKEEVKYLGKGCVEVEFKSDIDYKNSKVTVKDTSGKIYTASIYKRGDDEVKFKVKNYKAGKSYNFTVSGARKEGTKDYGKVSGTFRINAASSGNITAAKAKEIALKDAGLKKSQVYDLEADKEKERGTTFYEVSFETKNYEYEYDISLKGKILKKEVERD